MRICHVSPHLPPDQAANALLAGRAGRLGARARRRRHVRRARAGARPRRGADSLPGRVVAPAAHAADVRGWRALLADRHAGSRARAIAARSTRPRAGARLLHLHSNGLIVEVAAAWAGAGGMPYVLTLYGTEIWHYRRRWPIDPFTRAYRRARARSRSTASGCSRRARSSSGSIGPGSRSSIRPSATAFAPRRRRRRARRWRARARHRRAARHAQRQAPARAGGPALSCIDAFARVARGRRDVRLVICGTGPLRAGARSAGARDAASPTA